MKKIFLFTLLFSLFFGGPLYILFSGKLVLNQPWWKANRSSAHIAPDPKTYKKAIFQIYAARAYNWRGTFAIHPWIAVKPKYATKYTIYQCLGWNILLKKPIIDIKQDIPDRIWFGHRPWLLYNVRGKDAEKLISQIKDIAQKYPYQHNYRLWPGPNSNTFIAYVIRHLPSVKIRLPLTAIGKDYLANSLCTNAISKTGIQCSIKGLLGFTISKTEGLEINLFGFSFSINLDPPFFHLPGID